MSMDKLPISRMWDGPVPGQSLTQPKGNRPYEKPPQFTDPDKAMEFLFNRLTQLDTATQVVGMLKAGAPITVITSTLLMHGFSEGRWTPDVALLLAGPLSVLIRKIGELGKVGKMTTGTEKPTVDPVFMKLQGMHKDDPVALVKQAEAATPIKSIKRGGLGSPKAS